MSEPRDNKHSGKLDEEFGGAGVDEQPDTADNRDYPGPAPQGGKGTPDQAEGEPDSD